MHIIIHPMEILTPPVKLVALGNIEAVFSPDVARHRTIVFEQGGFGGVGQAAVAEAIESTKKRVETIWSSSTGACTGLFFATGNSSLGLGVYEQAVAAGVTDYKRVISFKALDLKVLGQIINGALPHLSEQLKQSSTSLYVAHTYGDGSGKFVLANESTDPLRVILGSCRIPGLARRIMADQQVIYDGAIFRPSPVMDAVASDADAIIVVLTQPPGKALIDKTLERIVKLLPMKQGLRRRILDMDNSRRDAIALATRNDLNVPIVVLYPENMPIGTFVDRSSGQMVSDVYNSLNQQALTLLKPFSSAA